MPDIETQQLRYFVETARLGKISAAAKKLCVTEQALSKSIRSLEASMGKDLFTRSRSGMALTPFGEFFLKRAQRAIDALDLAKRSPADFDSGFRRSVSLGMPAHCLVDHGGSLNPAKLSAVQERFRGVAFNFLELPVPIIEKGLEQGKLRFGIGAAMSNKGYRSLVLGSYPVAVVVHNDSELARKGKATVQEVARYTHALAANDASLLATLGIDAEKVDISPFHIDSADPSEMIVDARTVMVLPEQHALRTTDASRATVLPLMDARGRQAGVTLAINWRDEPPLDDAELALLEHVASLYGKTAEVA